MSRYGVVRVFPAGTPYVPPAIPTAADGGYPLGSHCTATLPVQEAPEAAQILFPLYGLQLAAAEFGCTRPPHRNDGGHVCHVLTPAPEFKPLMTVVWGGE